MIRRASKLIGYTINTDEGDIGKARGFCFDDSTWAIRYLLVNTGGWLHREEFLLPAGAVGRAVDSIRVLTSIVTREQVRNCPKLRNRGLEGAGIPQGPHAFHEEEAYWGSQGMKEASGERPVSPDKPAGRMVRPPAPSLRATVMVVGHEVRARDGAVGRVADFLVNDDPWMIPYLVVQLGNLRKVAMPTELVHRLSPVRARIYVNVSGEIVRGCPALDPRTGTIRWYSATGSAS